MIPRKPRADASAQLRRAAAEALGLALIGCAYDIARLSEQLGRLGESRYELELGRMAGALRGLGEELDAGRHKKKGRPKAAKEGQG
jgi:hypothetical protein